jgi:hypothetical protein
MLVSGDTLIPWAGWNALYKLRLESGHWLFAHDVMLEMMRPWRTQWQY